MPVLSSCDYEARSLCVPRLRLPSLDVRGHRYRYRSSEGIPTTDDVAHTRVQTLQALTTRKLAATLCQTIQLPIATLVSLGYAPLLPLLV